jgi:hypothetical protein
MSVRRVERPIANRAIGSLMMKGSGADIVTVLSARYRMEDIIGTIVRFVSIPVMSMIVNQEIE